MGKWHRDRPRRMCPGSAGSTRPTGSLAADTVDLGWQPNERQYTLPLTRNGGSTTDVPAHLTTALGDEAAAFIKRHLESPWMLYLAFNAPHTPHEPTAERLEKFAHIANPTRRRYLAQLSLLDDAIGTVTGALALQRPDGYRRYARSSFSATTAATLPADRTTAHSAG